MPVLCRRYFLADPSSAHLGDIHLSVFARHRINSATFNFEATCRPTSLPVLEVIMRARTCCLLTIVALAFLPSCQNSTAPRGSWVPEMEQTDFEYLRDAGERIKKDLQAVREHLSEGRTDNALASLAKAQDATKVLVYYGIPMTEVRQLIYDASRFHALERLKESVAHIDKAEEVLNEISQHGNTPILDMLKEPHAMVDELQSLLEKEYKMSTTREQDIVSLKVAEKFQELGHKINMMALKSDIVLSGVYFDN